MSTWLYQMSPKLWSPERYRVDIWEDERWAWPVGAMSGNGKKPQPGDILVMFFAQSGFYGWAVVLEWLEEAGSQLRFKPVPPSDTLKMCPWWNNEAASLADEIRGEMKQRTLWIVKDALATQLRHGILAWAAGRTASEK